MGPVFAVLRGWVGPLKKSHCACGVRVEWARSSDSVEGLEDSGLGGQTLRDILRIVAPGGTRFRGDVSLNESGQEKP